MSAVTDIYDIEGAVHAGVGKVFLALGFKCYTPLDPPNVQRPRPRLDAVFVLGPGTRQCKIVGSVDPTGLDPTGMWSARTVAWKGRLQVEALTAPDPASHSKYRAEVREVMGRFANLMNFAQLQFHSILGPVSDLGSSPTYSPGKGLWATAMNYEFGISIQADAWDALIPEES